MTRKLLALFISIAVVTPASAGNIKLGNAELNPYYGLTTAYDDNIYRVPANENGHAVAGGGKRSSWIIKNDVGLKMKMPTGNHTITAAGGLQAENYDKQSKANNGINKNANAGWAYEGSKAKAHVKNNYINTQDPAFNPSVAGDLVRRERNWVNTANFGGEWGHDDHFFFGGDWDWRVQKYLNRAGGTASLANTLNTSINTFGIKTGMNLAPKTRAYFSFKRKLVHYTEETRQDHHRDWLADVGIEGKFTGKLKGRVEVGMAWLKFDQSRTVAGATASGIDRHGRVMRINTALDWKASESCQFVWKMNRGQNESASTASRYYVTAGTSLDYVHTHGKLKLKLSGGFSQARHAQNFTTTAGENKARRDDNYNKGISVDYKITDSVSTGLAYDYKARFSTFSREYNYKNSVTSWNLKLAL
jgi:hypothetical protein